MRIALVVAPEKLPAGVSEVFLRSIVRTTCEMAFSNVFGKEKKGVKLEIVFVSDKKIAQLNRDYRNKDKPTDVLSFGEFGNQRQVSRVKAKTLELGTLVLSLSFIKRSAKEDGVSWKKELIFVLSHGVLHLLGYDHSEAMFRIQDAATETLS